MPRAVCPRCSTEFTIKAKQLRTKARCPKCNRLFHIDAQAGSDEPKTEAPMSDAETDTGLSKLTCTVCGEVAEAEPGAPSIRCPLCGGVMRQAAPRPRKPTPELEEEPEEEEPEEKEPVEEKQPKRRKKIRRRRRRSKLSTRPSGRLGGLKGKKAMLGAPIAEEHRVGFGRRTLAFFLDCLIIGAAGSVIGVLLVMFYAKEMSETFSYPEDVRSAPEITSRLAPDLVDDLDDVEEEEEAEEDETEAEGTEGLVVTSNVDGEGSEDEQPLPPAGPPRLLFDGRLGQIIGSVLAVLFIYPFFGIVELVTAASIGKKILGMKVRAEDGRFARGNALFGRYMIKYGLGVSAVMAVLATVGVARALGDIILIVGALDGLFFFVSSFVAISSHRQAVHDQLTMTAVYPDVVSQMPEE